MIAEVSMTNVRLLRNTTVIVAKNLVFTLVVDDRQLVRTDQC